MHFLKWCFFEFQLKLCKGISYAAVAAHADKNGRRKLAAMLIEHEPRSSKQVPFFFFLKLHFLLFLSFSFHWEFSTVKFIIHYNFDLSSGSTLAKHRRRRYSSYKGNWKWWYRSGLPCPVSYLAEGITYQEMKVMGFVDIAPHFIRDIRLTSLFS